MTEAEKVGGYGTLEPSTGNNPITFAIPREKGSLVMDMAVSRGVHAPGEGLDRTHAKNRENGIPVTEETWARILQAEKENVQKTAPKF